MKKKEEIPKILYLYIHSQLGKLTLKGIPLLNKDGLISEENIKFGLCKWNIPKCLYEVILKEMERLNLIKKENNMYRVFKSEFEIEELGKYYISLEIFKDLDKN